MSDDDKPWFDQNVKQLYKDYVSALCKFNNYKSTENHDNLIGKKKLYKKSELYISHEGCRLELLKRNNPKHKFLQIYEKKPRTVVNVSLQ